MASLVRALPIAAAILASCAFAARDIATAVKPALTAVPAFDPGFQASDLSTPESLRALFLRWSAQHRKAPLSNEQDELRFQAFADNVRRIHAHNSRLGVTHLLALNRFADLTPSEFKAQHYGLDLSLRRSRTLRSATKDGGAEFSHSKVVPPKVHDWRKLGVVTPVKNQGFCGSCWSFSATGAIEGINAIVSGRLVSLSEQELLDCDVLYDQGCMGGLMDYAFDFVIANGGLDTEEDYQYLANQDTCKVEKLNKHVVTIDGYEDVPENNETALLLAVAAQPVSVAIEADEAAFQFYAQGIITADCGTALDHGVLAVGYGEENGTQFWTLKNSWGEEWGENGYVRIARNVGVAEGMCGIAMVASYPTILSKSGNNAVATS